MREIKFRAWDKVDKKMVCVDNIDIASGYINLEMRINNYEVQQYTGLKDKNGKEIYEGDVLVTPKLEGHYSGVVRWHDEYASFVMQHLTKLPMVGDCRWDINYMCVGEVVGNIYENPELLEE